MYRTPLCLPGSPIVLDGRGINMAQLETRLDIVYKAGYSLEVSIARNLARHSTNHAILRRCAGIVSQFGRTARTQRGRSC